MRLILRISKTLAGKSLANQRSIRQIRQCFVLYGTLFKIIHIPFRIIKGKDKRGSDNQAFTVICPDAILVHNIN